MPAHFLYLLKPMGQIFKFSNVNFVLVQIVVDSQCTLSGNHLLTKLPNWKNERQKTENLL